MLPPASAGQQRLDPDREPPHRRRLTDAIAALMRRARPAGAIRGDVAPEDVLQMLFGICYARDDPDWQAPPPASSTSSSSAALFLQEGD